MKFIRGLPLKFGIGFATAGFLVGVALYAYSLYLSAHRRLFENPDLITALCPPVIASMAFDDRRVVWNLIGWTIIALVNGALYGAVGLVCGFVISRGRNDCSSLEH